MYFLLEILFCSSSKYSHEFMSRIRYSHQISLHFYVIYCSIFLKFFSEENHLKDVQFTFSSNFKNLEKNIFLFVNKERLRDKKYKSFAKITFIYFRFYHIRIFKRFPVFFSTILKIRYPKVGGGK